MKTGHTKCFACKLGLPEKIPMAPAEPLEGRVPRESGLHVALQVAPKNARRKRAAR
jgi:hypothetical protein